MKKYNSFDKHMVLLGIIIPFLVFFISMNTTYAYFTATATKKESTTTTATIKIMLENVDDTVTNSSGVITSSTEQGVVNKILPGDTLQVGGSLINAGSSPCYAILEFVVEITKQNSTIAEKHTRKYYTFVNGENSTYEKQEILGSPNNFFPSAGIIAKDGTREFTLNYTFAGEEYGNEYKNASATYKVRAHAIQTENLASTEAESAKVATNELMANLGNGSNVVYGNSIQATGTGKNLLNPKNNVFGTITPTTAVINSSYKWATTTDYIALEAGSYTLSCKTGVNLRHIALFNQNKELSNCLWTNRVNPYKFTIDSGYLIRIDFERDGNITIENLQTFFSDYEVQLEKGSTATEYEIYCGGAPAPTPTNPAEIQSVGEKTINLFNPAENFTTSTYDGVTISYLQAEDCFVLNGTAGSTTNFASRFVNITIPKGSKLSKSVTYVSGTITRPNASDYAMAYWGASDTLENRDNNNWTAVSVYNYNSSGATTCNYNYINEFWFYISKGVSFDDYKIKIQLEIGDTATEYEPYGKYKIEADIQGKNYINIQNVKSAQCVPNGNDLNVYIYAGNSSQSTSSTLKELCPNIEIGKTYMLHFNTNAEQVNFSIGSYSTAANRWSNQQSRTISESDLSAIVRIGNQGGESRTITLSNIQIVENGVSATEYEPYIGTKTIFLNEPLRKIGDVADYVDLETGIVVRRIGAQTYTGSSSEGWTVYGLHETYYSFHIDLPFAENIMRVPMICNRLPSQSGYAQLYYGRVLGCYVGYIQTSSARFVASSSSSTNINDFKTELAENPLEIIYQLAEPNLSEKCERIYIPSGATVTIKTTIPPTTFD